MTIEDLAETAFRGLRWQVASVQPSSLVVPPVEIRKPKTVSRRVVDAIPFFVIHLVPLLALLPGIVVRPIDWVVCGALYFIRMFGVTGVYHRYFAHRTYKTSRWFQFVLAMLAQSSAQKGALWWAAHHRHHHKHSDQPQDVHSPVQRGFWYAHVGWMFDGTDATDYAKIKDFAKYPELVFLNKLWWLPPAMLGFGVWLVLGWSGLLIGFAFSTVLLWHGTFTINSFTHIFGKRVYPTTDTSKNSMFFALLTMGEGWHNNHHYYQASTRQGFHWWQIDMTYYLLKMLSFVGLVWDIREPPAEVVAGTWRPSKHREVAPTEELPQAA